MKKFQIVLLLFITGAIAVLISFMGTLTTYDTVETARNKPGKYVHLIAMLDHSQPIEYDAIKDPNYLSFTAIDSLGDAVRVIYSNAKPENLEVSERLVLKGAFKDNYFECKEILMKCPSKYKDDLKAAEKNLPVSTMNADPVNNSLVKKQL